MVFRTLKYRNFRIFFLGQSVSLVGTWMQYVAMSWLVYRMTGSAFMLGVVGFASQFPTFILSPFTGVLADRHNRHKILLFTQVLALLQALILAILTITGLIQVWHIIVMGVFLGCVNSLDIPVRQSFILQMIEEKENLGNAIALNSMMFNVARLIGPSIAGVLIAIAGEGVCFLVNAISYVAVIVSLVAMDEGIKIRKDKKEDYNIFKELKEGFNYAFGSQPIRAILLLLGIISLMGMSYAVLMPVFAKDVLGGGPHTLGFLMAAVGLGALAGTVYLASGKKAIVFGNTLPVSAGIFGIGITAFSFSHNMWISLFLLFIAGFGIMVQMASSNTILQTIVDDDKRGRVMSFYTMAFMGMAPLGSLLAGAMATKFGVASTLVISGICCIIAAVIFAMKRRVVLA
ncbi:MAG: MFS transporter [Candidatus Omnitrophica bacterium CG22_combo_CG10-13_8_21_14_all_43_16]|nr:MAG: MFS transporter [Candidatus Omnitrophica bacterium CG22_combo_CG10-13_8_21_14_all_43_16]